MIPIAVSADDVQRAVDLSDVTLMGTWTGSPLTEIVKPSPAVPALPSTPLASSTESVACRPVQDDRDTDGGMRICDRRQEA